MYKPLQGFIFSVLLGFSAMTLAAPVDINTASAQELAATIKGVGDKRAAAIIAYREKNGPFKSVDEIAKVPGLGPKVLEENRDNMTTGKK